MLLRKSNFLKTLIDIYRVTAFRNFRDRSPKDLTSGRYRTTNCRLSTSRTFATKKTFTSIRRRRRTFIADKIRTKSSTSTHPEPRLRPTHILTFTIRSDLIILFIYFAKKCLEHFVVRF